MKFKTLEQETPKEGELVLCMCPNWCELGYQVAEFVNGRFDYPESPNDLLHKNVVAWASINFNP